jgi:flavodoxin
MKALITYFSKTGNTEKVARAIYDALPVDKDIKPIQDLDSAAGYDIVFCGFPVFAHSVPGKAQPFIKALGEGQKVAFFSTHGSLRGGQLPKQAFENAIGLAPKAKVRLPRQGGPQDHRDVDEATGKQSLGGRGPERRRAPRSGRPGRRQSLRAEHAHEGLIRLR